MEAGEQGAGRGRRRVLFLQGPPTGFWRELAGAFEAAGHETRRVNLSTADWLAWRRPGAANYRGRLGGWRRWIGRFLEREGVTDVLYYADRLPYHVIAGEEAEARGIPAFAVEFGYLRPDWLTLERRGMGAFSRFPADPQAVRRIARQVPPPPRGGPRYPHSFAQEACCEVLFNLANALFCWPYPFFEMDKRHHPLLDYPSWIPRLLASRRRAREAEAVVRDCAGGAWPYHLVALQLEQDYQIRDNAPYGSLSEAIGEVVASFARHAPEGQRLIFKMHPLDNGLEGWPRVVARAAARHGVAERVACIDGGDLETLMRHAQGVITVNSTVGLHAVQAGAPAIALGAAVYDMPGLTHQGPLSRFWSAPERPDAALVADLVRALAATIQVKGSFYNRQGRRRAAEEIVARVAQGRVNAPDALVERPPRLPVRRRAGAG
ncbi:MAG: capsule biosynthesis protein [Pseudomonadota bacterium]